MISYKVSFFLMIIALPQIFTGVFMWGPKVYVPFFMGRIPLLIVVAPIVGLALGVLDVYLSRLVLSRIDQARLELDASSIEEAQTPYIGQGVLGIVKNGLYVLGEESIRGIILIFAGHDLPVYAVVALGTFLFFFSRRLPIYMRLVKLIDDLVLTLLFLWGGVISAWLAHLVLNTYILWPLLRYEPK